ncbi:hypothetical protein LY78DRAFT_220395 [Colletotrichum sublineola]|nr:hypothetical protein LY78DRAFT_220395 [Colletotrichum sublineola]
MHREFEACLPMYPNFSYLSWQLGGSFSRCPSRLIKRHYSMRIKLFISATKRLGVSRAMQNAFNGQSDIQHMNHHVVVVRFLALLLSSASPGPKPPHFFRSSQCPLMNPITDPALRLSVRKESERRLPGEAQQPSHHIKSPHTFFQSQSSPTFLSGPIRSHYNIILSLIR